VVVEILVLRLFFPARKAGDEPRRVVGRLGGGELIFAVSPSSSRHNVRPPTYLSLILLCPGENLTIRRTDVSGRKVDSFLRRVVLIPN
jgi:hypothetical protein